MKKILIALILLLLFSAGCRPVSNSGNTKKDNKRSEADSTMQSNLPKETEMKVTMTSERSTYPALTERVDIIITNNTSIEYYIGDHSIEFFNGSAWQKIPLEILFHDLLITLLPHEAREFSIYLHPEQYNYAPGKYRVLKTIWSADEKYDITCEFYLDA